MQRERTHYIEHTCGHTTRHDLVGHAAQIRDEIALLKTTACTACQETPPQAGVVSELLANQAAAQYGTVRVPASDTVLCSRCRVRLHTSAMTTVYGSRLCPDCWHRENDGNGFGE